MEAVMNRPALLPRLSPRHVRLAALFALVMAGTGYAGSAKAEFRVCNGTQNLVGVAIGYRAKEGWISEGWWQIPANTCTTLIEGELKSRYYYLYARTRPAVAAGPVP